MKSRMLRAGLGLASVVLIGACAPSQPPCGFTEQTVSQVQLGMTVPEVIALAHCNGQIHSSMTTAGVGTMTIVQWPGPGIGITSVTFMDNRVAVILR